MKLAIILSLTALVLSACATTTPTSAADAKKAEKAERIADRVNPRAY